MTHALTAILLAGLLAAPARAGDLLVDASERDAGVEDRLHSLLVHALTADGEAVQGDVDGLVVWDDERQRDGHSPTGLADDARYLAAALAPTRDACRDALHDVLRAHPDDRIRHLAEHQLEADDAAAADQLLADDRHNRRAQLVNDAVRPLGAFSPIAFIAAVNPFLLAGSAVDSVVTTAVNLWNYNRLSAREREALVRYQTELVRAPDTGDAPEIARAIRQLGTKRAAALCDETVDAGKDALDAGDLERARFYLRDAQALDGCARRADKPLGRLARSLAAQDAAEEAGRWPVDDPPQPGLDATVDHDALVLAVAGGDPSAMGEAADRFVELHRDSPLVPGARYAAAAADDLNGRHYEARVALEEVARARRTEVGRHARALLDSPERNRLDAIRLAEKQHSREVLRFVLLGGMTDGRTALYDAAHLGAEGVTAAQSIGIFNVVGVLTRAWGAWRHDPASNQAIIDNGEEFLAREPASPETADVHARLAQAYERAGNYQRALMHYEATADPRPAKIAALEAKLADAMLEDARRHNDDPDRLQTLVRLLGDTTAAATAREKLEKMKPPTEATVPRDVLAANPALIGPSGLGIEPTLLDGDRSNGELADAGVTVTDGGLRLTLENPDGHGEHTETRTLSPDAYARARAAALEALYTRLVTADRRDPEAGRYEKYIPFFIQGSIDDNGGIYVYPGIKTKRYESEDSPLYQ